jgi:hypothetical protein
MYTVCIETIFQFRPSYLLCPLSKRYKPCCKIHGINSYKKIIRTLIPSKDTRLLVCVLYIVLLLYFSVYVFRFLNISFYKHTYFLCIPDQLLDLFNKDRYIKVHRTLDTRVTKTDRISAYLFNGTYQFFDRNIIDQ